GPQRSLFVWQSQYAENRESRASRTYGWPLKRAPIEGALDRPDPAPPPSTTGRSRPIPVRVVAASPGRNDTPTGWPTSLPRRSVAKMNQPRPAAIKASPTLDTLVRYGI